MSTALRTFLKTPTPIVAADVRRLTSHVFSTPLSSKLRASSRRLPPFKKALSVVAVTHLCLTLVSVPLVAAENFPEPYDSDPHSPPMAAAEAARSFKMPTGFKVSGFVSERDVRQPIAIPFDPWGRLWVAENDPYVEAKVRDQTNLADHGLIFADTNDDERFRAVRVSGD